MRGKKNKMVQLNHIVSSFVIFAVLITLLITGYSGLVDNYDVQKTVINGSNDNVIDKLNQINIISGINDSVSGVYKISNPNSNAFDVLGALATAGIGVIKIVTGIISLPIEILGIITDFYYIPPIISIGIGLIFIIYIGFILLKNYTRT